MGSKRADIFEETIARQKQYADAFRVPEDTMLYHYAGIDNVWKILESDAFLARNIRFSNDSEEYKLGEEWIRQYAKGIFETSQQKIFNDSILHGIQMFYMICFCKDGDLLSQWRGYAKEGVSLGMDFHEEEENQESYAQMFTLVNNKSTQEKLKNKYKIDDQYSKVVEMPYQVFYVNKNSKQKKSSGKKPDDRLLKKVMKNFKDVDTQTDLLLNLIPLIKDCGFYEESEYRILFNLSNMGSTEAANRRLRSKKIEYIDKEGRKLPNIIVEVGDGEQKEKDVTEVILGSGIKEIAENLSKTQDEIEQIYREIADKLDSGNIGCSRSDRKRAIYIGEGKNQEEIMVQIEDVLQKNGISIGYEDGVKIWCRGHLPIREVIIGPGEKKEKIRESLKHYMRNTYWLRYVEVKDSKIPLQS